MKFKDDYFNGEYKDGFYIRPIMKCVWAAHLEVLEEITSLCRKHDIKYYASAGTLLGAVRHQGIIPWDDDIDISMKREDYQRFVYYAKKELPKGWRIKNPFLDVPEFEVYSRVENSDFINLDVDFLKQFHGCPYPVGIDVFPLDYIPRDLQAQKLQQSLLEVVGNLARGWDVNMEENDKKWDALIACEEICGIKLKREASISHELYKLADGICAMYGEDDGEKLTVMSYYVRGIYKGIPKECYDDFIDVPFDSITIPIPIGYDQELRTWYGSDYMIPVQGMAEHEYPYFRRLEEYLRNEFKKSGVEMPGWMQWT